jgi:hypothetical protein
MAHSFGKSLKAATGQSQYGGKEMKMRTRAK